MANTCSSDIPTINSLILLLGGVAHAVSPIRHNPRSISFIAIIGYFQRLDLFPHEFTNRRITMSASGRKQPLASPDSLSGECPLFPNTSHSDDSICACFERLLLTQSRHSLAYGK
jgi:hypothetical protein